jgi:membrane protein DedA with SNARE-associated domain
VFEILDQLGSHIQEFIVSAGYLGILVVMLLEVVFPPIPSELILPYSGFLVSQSKFSFLGVWLTSVLGSVLGALILYYIGQWAGDHVIRGFLQRYGRWLTLSEKDYDRTLQAFDKHGNLIVLFGRLIPIIRSLVSLPAGADHMPLRQFLTYTFIGSGIWNGLLIGAGLVLGENWERVMETVEAYQLLTMIVVAILGMVVAIWRGRSLLQDYRMNRERA